MYPYTVKRVETTANCSLLRHQKKPVPKRDQSNVSAAAVFSGPATLAADTERWSYCRRLAVGPPSIHSCRPTGTDGTDRSSRMIHGRINSGMVLEMLNVAQ